MMEYINIPTLLVCLGLELMILGDKERSKTTLIGGIISMIGWILHLLLVLKVI